MQDLKVETLKEACQTKDAAVMLKFISVFTTVLYATHVKFYNF
jgi:hypothetical protein